MGEKVQPMNSILASLAKEREARVQKIASTKQTSAPPKKSKKSKSKKGKKLGGEKRVKETPSKQEDDLDDMAFLDAQIEKVQTSHGRKIDGQGSNYRTIMNGILVTKPKPTNKAKPKNSRASSALSSK